MTRKFLFCFPLRTGNIVFGYIIITIAIVVAAYSLYELGLSIVHEQDYERDEKFGNWENLQQIFGQKNGELVAIITKVYYFSYVVLALMLFIFSVVFICGAHKANYCLVTTFFVYSFFHLFLTIALIVWEATSSGWIQLGLIICSDLLLIICLFSVKYLMEAIRTGNIYSRPGEVFCKY